MNDKKKAVLNDLLNHLEDLIARGTIDDVYIPEAINVLREEAKPVPEEDEKAKEVLGTTRQKDCIVNLMSKVDSLLESTPSFRYGLDEFNSEELKDIIEVLVSIR